MNPSGSTRLTVSTPVVLPTLAWDRLTLEISVIYHFDGQT
jgi:hypothetical protein